MIRFFSFFFIVTEIIKYINFLFSSYYHHSTLL